MPGFHLFLITKVICIFCRKIKKLQIKERKKIKTTDERKKSDSPTSQQLSNSLLNSPQNKTEKKIANKGHPWQGSGFWVEELRPGFYSQNL
jgi:retron-type reverse transcriptase